MYVNVYVPQSGGSVVPKSDVYKCSDPSKGLVWKEKHGFPDANGHSVIAHETSAIFPIEETSVLPRMAS